MARVVIEIDGDASGAEAALGDVQGSLSDLDSASESAGGAVGGLNTKLVNSASAVGIAKTGLEVLVGGFNILGQSAESYFARTEEGQEMWADLGRQAGELKGVLFELLVGTSDQTEAFERMSAVVGDVVSAGRALVDVISPVVNLIRTAAGTTRSFAMAIAGVDSESRDAARGLAQMSAETASAETAARAFMEVFNNSRGVETIADLSEDLADELGPELAQAFENVSSSMFSVLMEGNAAREGFLTVRGAIGAFSNELHRASDLKPEIRSLLRDMMNDEEGRQRIWSVASQSVVEWQNILASSSQTTRAASTGIVDVSISAEEAAISVARLAIETGNATLQILEQKHALDLLNAALGEKADRDKIASESAVSQLEKKRELMEQEAEFKRAMILKTEGLEEQIEAKKEARAARQKERVDLAKAGFQTLTNSAVSMAAASIKSGKKSAEETRKMIGDELVALGAMGLAKSAMMLFEPGKQALAVGLGVASVAAMALGSKMGATAISGGGGVAAPAAGQSQSVTNVTFQNNFAQIGSRDQFLRVTGDAFQEAVDEGYIALPRGA